MFIFHVSAVLYLSYTLLSDVAIGWRFTWLGIRCPTLTQCPPINLTYCTDYPWLGLQLANATIGSVTRNPNAKQGERLRCHAAVENELMLGGSLISTTDLQTSPERSSNKSLLESCLSKSASLISGCSKLLKKEIFAELKIFPGTNHLTFSLIYVFLIPCYTWLGFTVAVMLRHFPPYPITIPSLALYNRDVVSELQEDQEDL